MTLDKYQESFCDQKKSSNSVPVHWTLNKNLNISNALKNKKRKNRSSHL